MVFPAITIEELKEKLDRKDPFTLLDIRDAARFFQGHIRDAVNIPFERLTDLADERLDQTRLLVVYGEDGKDVLPIRAAETLATRAFANIAVLEDGFVKWNAAGYITEGGD